MAARPTWQGHLRLSLVTCPVALYTATDSGAEVSFHLINPKTGNRIRMIPTDPDTGPVERRDLVKGYEVDKDQYVILTNDEIDQVRLETTKTLNIERFVDLDDIDRLYWNAPYFLAPDGEIAVEAYSVIREAMVQSNRVALGRLVLHGRERLFALEPREQGMTAWSLRAADEVRDPEAAFDDIPRTRADRGMVDIARRIIEQQEGPFDPSQFTDRYEQALKGLIAEKQKGQTPLVSAEPDDTRPTDLMEALRRSLGRAPDRAPRAAPAKRRPRGPAKTRRAS